MTKDFLRFLGCLLDEDLPPEFSSISAGFNSRLVLLPLPVGFSSLFFEGRSCNIAMRGTDVKSPFKKLLLLLRIISEGTGTKNTREPTHI